MNTSINYNNNNNNINNSSSNNSSKIRSISPFSKDNNKMKLTRGSPINSGFQSYSHDGITGLGYNNDFSSNSSNTKINNVRATTAPSRIDRRSNSYNTVAYNSNSNSRSNSNLTIYNNNVSSSSISSSSDNIKTPKNGNSPTRVLSAGSADSDRSFKHHKPHDNLHMIQSYRNFTPFSRTFMELSLQDDTNSNSSSNNNNLNVDSYKNKNKKFDDGNNDINKYFKQNAITLDEYIQEDNDYDSNDDDEDDDKSSVSTQPIISTSTVNNNQRKKSFIINYDEKPKLLNKAKLSYRDLMEV
jgi:hypothetical protein